MIQEKGYFPFREIYGRLDLPVETAEFISKIMSIHFLEDWQEGRAERKVAQLLCLRVR